MSRASKERQLVALAARRRQYLLDVSAKVHALSRALQSNDADAARACIVDLDSIPYPHGLVEAQTAPPAPTPTFAPEPNPQPAPVDPAKEGL